MFDAPNCTLPAPASAAGNAGIAGSGVLLSFVITAGFAIITSTSLTLQEIRIRKTGNHNVGIIPATVRRKLLSSYSDQQILNGIGLQCVGLAQVGTLVPYHFFIIWMLSLLSMATHNATLLALVHDFRRDWVLRWLRQFLMFVNLALSCVFGAFILVSKIKNTPPTLPIGCVWSVATSADGSSPDVGSAYVATILTIAANCIIFGAATWYLHSRRQRFFQVVQVVGLVLMAASAVGASVRVLMISQAFGHPPIPLSDPSETYWSFGQLLAILMLILPLISIIEIYRGELQVAAPVSDESTPLFEAEMQNDPKIISNSFQPNPYLSHSSLNVHRR